MGTKAQNKHKRDSLPRYLHRNEVMCIRLIIAARIAQGLTIPQAAKLAGIPTYRWRRIEAGKLRYYYNTLGYLHKILNKIGCTLELRAVSVTDYRPLLGIDPAEIEPEPKKDKKKLRP